MKYITLIILSMLLLACNEKIKDTFSNPPESVNDHIKDSLAFELCSIYGFDQGIRDREVWMGMDRSTKGKIDSINFTKFIEIVKEFGYPNEELLGKKNYEHACVAMSGMAIMLHNPHKLIYEKQYFDLFLNEVNKGNLDREFFATILDKYYWNKSRGENVMYGSQFGEPCIETKEETNILRKRIGLESLSDKEFKECD